MEILFKVHPNANLLQNGAFRTTPASNIDLVETSEKTDFAEMEKKSQEVLETGLKLGSQIDQVIGRALFEALHSIERSVLNDPNFWQWMSLVRFRSLALSRVSSLEDTPAANLLSGKSLNNQNRHVFQRLFNILDTTYANGQIDDDFKVGTQVLKNQDLITNFGDSIIGLDKSFCSYHIRQAAALGSVATQQYVKRLRAQSQVFLTEYSIPEELSPT